MGYNVNDRYNPTQPYVSSFVPLPLDEIAAVGAMKQQTQDKAEEERIALLGKNWNRLPGDMGDSIKHKQEIDSQLASFSNKDFNDPSVRSEWYKTKMNLVNDFGPNGVAGSQEANFNAYKDYEKELLSKSKELGWSTDELNSHLNQVKNQFKTKNSDGSINNFQGPGVASYVDPNEWASKALKDVADDTGVVQLKKYGSLNEVTDAFRSGEINHRDYNKVMNALALRASGDSKLKQSLEQEGEFRGQRGWSDFISRDENGKPLIDKSGAIIPNNRTPFGQILSGITSGATYQKVKEDYMKVSDPLALERYKKDINNPNQKFTSETGATSTLGSWTKVAGLDNFFEDSGEIKTDDVNNLNTVTFTNTKGEKKTITYPTSKEARQGELEQEKNGFQVLNREPDSRTIDNRIQQAQTELFSRAAKLGIRVNKPDGSINGEATKQAAISYYKGLSVYSNYSVPFQSPNITKNLSNDLFGKTSNISNMKIYEDGNEESASKYEGVEDKSQFKNSKAIGLDFTSSQPGAIKFVAPTSSDKDKYGDTPFIAISRNKTLQEQMRPVQELTHKSIEASKTGNVDKAAQTLTSFLKGSVVKDIYGHDIKLESLGIPVASSKDNNGTLYVSYLDISMGSPMIQVLKKSPGKPLEIKSLDEIQEDKTGEIFNNGGALSQYQKQGSKEESPTENYEE